MAIKYTKKETKEALTRMREGRKEFKIRCAASLAKFNKKFPSKEISVNESIAKEIDEMGVGRFGEGYDAGWQAREVNGWDEKDSWFNGYALGWRAREVDRELTEAGEYDDLPFKNGVNPVVRLFNWYEGAFYTACQWPFKALIWFGEFIVRTKLFPVIMTAVLVYLFILITF